MNSYRELKVYQKSLKLVAKVYRLTASLPDEEKYGLVSQFNRASVSVVANIAEGYDRKTTKEFIHFLYIAKGSCAELKALLDVLLEIQLMNINEYEEFFNFVDDISKMLHGLISSLNKRN